MVKVHVECVCVASEGVITRRRADDFQHYAPTTASLSGSGPITLFRGVPRGGPKGALPPPLHPNLHRQA